MKIIYIIFLVIGYIATYSPAFSQQNINQDVITSPKWEIGTDLLWLINKNNFPSYSLLLRRQIGEHSALRLRGGYLQNSNQPHFPNDNILNTYSLVRIGYEYQKELSIRRGLIRSLVYGGIDLFTRYQFDSFQIDNTITNPGQVLVVRVNETTNERGGGVFIGFKYFLTTHLSLSSESSFQFSNLSFSQTGRANGFSSDISYTYGKYQFLPLTTINLSFHF